VTEVQVGVIKSHQPHNAQAQNGTISCIYCDSIKTPKQSFCDNFGKASETAGLKNRQMLYNVSHRLKPVATLPCET